MLHTVVGGMFAGKTSELLRQGKRHELAGRLVLYIKPEFDSRYGMDVIGTHDGETVVAKTIDKPNALLAYNHLKYEVFVIDEIQFFDERIIDYIDFLLQMDKTVIVGGLDMDYEGKPFENSAQLLAMADQVTKLKAVCQLCGDDATFSNRTMESTERHALGGQGDYYPTCRKCRNTN
ncbi:thymidine kinase [Geomicrobium sp. JCM 19055]|uniref:thymidine kinase n=1 Tax=Geomicrobium sp. JCM 19055 TaxID=1460649 RepID=UPI00045EDB38|nr:hypothetical protein [Geomicrobium sp. JCM 19055]GAK00880.1 thymidine kinase [Geomicrobium sp. JCM 19055]